MTRVYIASAYTKGDCAANVRSSLDAFAQLLKLGFAPHSPLLSHFVQITHPFDYETWMKLDMHWLAHCDAVLRLPGESAGAERELQEARKLKIPIFRDIETLTYWRTAKEVNNGKE